MQKSDVSTDAKGMVLQSIWNAWLLNEHSRVQLSTSMSQGNRQDVKGSLAWLSASIGAQAFYPMLTRSAGAQAAN